MQQCLGAQIAPAAQPTFLFKIKFSAVLRLLILFAFLFPKCAVAQSRTEAELAGRLVEALAINSHRAYVSLFPGPEDIAKAVLKAAGPESAAGARMQYLLDNPEALDRFDAGLDSVRTSTFNRLRETGAELGIQWSEVRLARFEFVAGRRTIDTLWEKVAPVRYLGYVFILDPPSRKTYCLTAADVVQLNGAWYGGALSRIFEASTTAEMDAHLVAARRAEKKGQVYTGSTAPTVADSADAEARDDGPRKEVVSRTVYTGMLDGEIPVQLYVRGIKGGCGAEVCTWEGLFKFGDDEWVLMDVTKAADRWTLAEAAGGGALDLTPKSDGKSFSGSWTSSTDGTGYEADLAEKPASTKKLRALDAFMEGGAEE